MQKLDKISELRMNTEQVHKQKTRIVCKKQSYFMCVCVCCVCERERNKETARERECQNIPWYALVPTETKEKYELDQNKD